MDATHYATTAAPGRLACPPLEHAFVRAMEVYGRIRRRDGVSWWGVFRDLDHADVFRETFLVASQAEHLRQHERFTRGDGDVEAHVLRHVESDSPANTVQAIVRKTFGIGSTEYLRRSGPIRRYRRYLRLIDPAFGV